MSSLKIVTKNKVKDKKKEEEEEERFSYLDIHKVIIQFLKLRKKEKTTNRGRTCGDTLPKRLKPIQNVTYNSFYLLLTSYLLIGVFVLVQKLLSL